MIGADRGTSFAPAQNWQLPKPEPNMKHDQQTTRSSACLCCISSRRRRPSSRRTCARPASRATPRRENLNACAASTWRASGSSAAN